MQPVGDWPTDTASALQHASNFVQLAQPAEVPELPPTPPPLAPPAPPVPVEAPAWQSGIVVKQVSKAMQSVIARHAFAALAMALALVQVVVDVLPT